MKFSQKFLRKRRGEFTEKFLRGIWNPNIMSWRDVIEDYLYISRKRVNNKFSMFKLQLNILTDLINNRKAIDEYNNKLTELISNKDNGSIYPEDFDHASGGRGGRRIARQKQRMIELVEFINTGATEYDGSKFQIIESNLKQVYYLKDLLNSINRARFKGYDSILIGSHLILEVVDLGKIDDPDNFKEYLRKRHESIKEQWKRKNDFVFRAFLIEKLEFSRNYIPYSILPFSVDICTDIIMGKLMISSILNFSEIMQMVEKAGWVIKDSFLFKSEEELKKLEGLDVNDVPILVVKRGNCSINVAHSYFGKLRYELWSPKSLINVLEEEYARGPNHGYDASLIDFIDDQRIWK